MTAFSLAGAKDLVRRAVHSFIAAGGRLQGIGGWRRYPAAAGMGALAATGFAPYYFLPGLIIGFSALVLLIDSTKAARAPKRAAFFTGWAFGFGYFLVGMYWLGFAFLVQADQFAWMIPIAVPGLMGFLGIYMALPVWLVSFRWGNGFERALILAAALSVFECLRGTLFTGLPWNLVGQSFAGNALLAQPAAWVGPYGLSLIVMVIAILPGTIWRNVPSAGPNWKPAALSAALFAALLTFGFARLALGPVTFDEDVTVAIMQPNVPQRDKMDPRKNDAHFRQLLTDTQSALPSSGLSFAIWPENAYPYLAQAEDAPTYFAELFPAEAHIIAGTYRSFDLDTQPKFANSAVVFGATVDKRKPVETVYDKHHLVPFGEYLPLKGLLKAIGLAQLAPVEDGFTPGTGPATLDIGGKPFAPLICYEDVFPRELYPHDDRPDWLVVVTNDAWFGDNAGPKQHLDIARLRAIESGLPMARSANTGISALIGPRGRILAEVALYSRGHINQKLPNAIPRTPYDRFGGLLYLALLLLVAGIAARYRLARSG